MTMADRTMTDTTKMFMMAVTIPTMVMINGGGRLPQEGSGRTVASRIHVFISRIHCRLVDLIYVTGSWLGEPVWVLREKGLQVFQPSDVWMVYAKCEIRA